jgi:predicted RNase H-like HicB family nuclease
MGRGVDRLGTPWNIYKRVSELIIMTSFSAVIHEEERMFVAKCPEVGTVSQGKTIDEALKNLKEASELYLEEFSRHQ